MGIEKILTERNLYQPRTCTYIALLGIACFVKKFTTFIFLKNIANVSVDVLY